MGLRKDVYNHLVSLTSFWIGNPLPMQVIDPKLARVPTFCPCSFRSFGVIVPNLGCLTSPLAEEHKVSLLGQLEAIDLNLKCLLSTFLMGMEKVF